MATDLGRIVDSVELGDSGFAAPTETEEPEPFGRDLRPIVDEVGVPDEGLALDVNVDHLLGGQEKGFADEFVSGLQSGTDQLQMSLFGVSRLVARELGIESLEDFSEEGIARNIAEAQLSATTVQGFTDIEDMDGLIRWAAGSLGNALPSLAFAVAGGGIGGVMAKQAVMSSIRKSLSDRIVRNLLKRGFAKKAANEAAARAMAGSTRGKFGGGSFNMLKNGMVRGTPNSDVIAQGFRTGAQTGAFVASGLPQTGEAEISLGDAGVESGLTALFAGVAGGLLEALPAVRLIDKMFPGVDKVVAKSFIKDFAVSAGIQSLLEGSTEGAQEIIQMAALAYHDPSFDMMDPENFNQVIDAFAAGALVGGVTGGAADFVGGVNQTARKARERLSRSKITLPSFNMDARSVSDPDSIKDFVPADNTLYQEIRGRVADTVNNTINPVMNRIRDTFQAGFNQVDRAEPALNAEVGKNAQTAEEAHNEFIEGHKHILDDVGRWAREQAAFVTDQATRLVGAERQVFLAKAFKEIQDQVTEVSETLAERAELVIDSLSNTIESSREVGIIQEITDVDRTRPESQFVFGKSKTEGSDAKGFKDRAGARQLLRKLRTRFPSANDSTFEIRESLKDGTFTVVLADSGQAPQLNEDKVVADALEKARKATRTNETRAKEAASISNKKGEGRTLIDVRTLVFEGRQVGGGDSQTAAQAFAAITGSMLDRGIINTTDFAILQEKFNELFPPADRVKTLASLKAREVTEANRDFEQIPFKARTAINEAIENKLNDEGLIGRTVKEAVDRAKRRQELLVSAMQNLDDQLARNPRLLDDPGDARVKVIGEILVREGEVAPFEGGQRSFDEDASFPDRERGTLVSRKILEDTEPSTESFGSKAAQKLPTERQAADQSASARESQDKKLPTNKELTERGKKELEFLLGRKKPKPIRTTEGDATKALNKLKDKKVGAWLPGMKNKKIVKQIDNIIQRVAKLLSDNIKIVVIDAQAQQTILDEGHPDAFLMRHLTRGKPSIVWNTQDIGATTMYIMIDDFSNPGRSLSAMMHEFGHAIHFDSWGSLTEDAQNELWEAFVKDTQSGKRGSGAFINEIGENQKFPNAMVNVFEFREWMADKFVDWMADRKQPKGALEEFLEAVGQKIEQLYEFMQSNAQRFNSEGVDETFGQFMDAVARGITQVDPAGTDIFFRNENAGGRSIVSLAEGTAITLDGGKPRGMTNPEWDLLKIRITEQYPVIAARAKLMTDWMHDAYHLVAAPSTSVMRSVGKRIPAVLKLVTIFNREEHGKAKKGANYHQRLKLMKGQFLEKRYVTITKNMTDEQKSSLIKRLRSMDSTGKKPRTAQEKAMRDLFDDMHQYMKDGGLPVGKIQNYFPKIWSRELLVNNKEKILKYLRGRMKEGEARAFYNSLIAQEADEAAALRELRADPIAMQSPSFRNMRSRTAGDPFFDQFLENNLDAVVGNYITAAVKRTEYNRVLGEKAPKGLTGGDVLPKKVWNSRGGFDAIIKQAKREGATEKDLQKMKNYVDANLGMYGRDDISDSTRTLLAGVIAYQNMRTLLFTVFASLPDLVGPGIRSGNMRGAFKTAIKNIRGIVKNDGDLATAARAFGTISSVSNQHILTEYVDNHFMPPTLRKWNTAFFKWTGLNFYTDVTRKFALAVGIDTIKLESEKVNNSNLTQKQRDRAKQFLAELGLTADSVNTWIGNGERVWGGLGYEQDSSTDQQVAEALVQFVDESIMSPNPSQRPIMASHPAAMLVYHLKGFIYAIHDVILKRMAHNFRIADTPAQVLAAISPAILMLALTAFGLELRELVTGSDRTGRMDGWDYTWTIFERSGMLGISQLGFDFESADERGQAEIAALAGPAIGQVGDLISRPASQTIPKAIPIVSQLPWLRDVLRGN